MRSTFLLCLYLVMFGPLLAQTPDGFHYQGVARNAQGAPLAGATIAIRLNIKDAAINGNTLYSETKSVTTNAFGLYSISINDGSGVKTGNFNAINWSAGPRFLQTEVDPANGTAFTDMGTQQMQSVPHSFSAKTLDGVVNPQNGDLLEFKDGNWSRKPKTERYMVAGFGGPPEWGNGGSAPSAVLNFIGPAAIITLENSNPIISINLMKPLGSVLASGGKGLNLNLGYRKAGETTVHEFNPNHRSTSLSVTRGTRIPFHLSGTYQTNFLTGETYEIGIVGFSSFAAEWNNNGYGMGYVEVSY